MTEFTVKDAASLKELYLFCKEPGKDITLKLFAACPHTNKPKLLYETKDIEDKELYRSIKDCSDVKLPRYIVGSDEDFILSKYWFVFK